MIDAKEWKITKVKCHEGQGVPRIKPRIHLLLQGSAEGLISSANNTSSFVPTSYPISFKISSDICADQFRWRLEWRHVSRLGLVLVVALNASSRPQGCFSSARKPESHGRLSSLQAYSISANGLAKALSTTPFSADHFFDQYVSQQWHFTPFQTANKYILKFDHSQTRINHKTTNLELLFFAGNRTYSNSSNPP